MIRAHGLRAFTVMILWASCAALRLDAALVSQGLLGNRAVAKQAIKDGHVTVAGKVIKKAAFSVDDAMLVDIRLEDGAPMQQRYVSRAGDKLRAALDAFKICVDGSTHILDIGASTGGFTDCLLDAGAASATCVDCGHDQV